MERPRFLDTGNFALRDLSGQSIEGPVKTEKCNAWRKVDAPWRIKRGKAENFE